MRQLAPYANEGYQPASGRSRDQPKPGTPIVPLQLLWLWVIVKSVCIACISLANSLGVLPVIICCLLERNSHFAKANGQSARASRLPELPLGDAQERARL